MTIDERQLALLKKTIRELTVEVQTLPMEKAAARLEVISIWYAELNLPDLADKARHAACRCGESDIAYRELLASQESAQ